MTYKPGTVAIATVNGKRNVRVFRTGVPSNMGWEFNHSDGKGHGWSSDKSLSVTDVRPLVVLDLSMWLPEYVARIPAWLRDVSHAAPSESLVRALADQIEAQTRLAIEEPKGLGAVVEDDKGAKFVRIPDGSWDSIDTCRLWGEFTPVRVLSEGVPS